MSAAAENLSDLLLLLNQLGIRLYLSNGELRYRARTGVVTQELLETLRARRSDLELLLASAKYDANCLVTIRTGVAGRIPLFCPHTIHGGVFDYRHLCEGLSADQPLFAFQALSFLCGERLRTSVEEMAAHYVEQLACVWPRGPILLYGASAGGLLALEMARQLQLQGRQIGFVALGDTISPTFYDSLPFATVDRLHWVSFVETYLPADVLEISPLDHPFWKLDEKARIDYLVRSAAASSGRGRLGVVDAASVELHHRAFNSYRTAYQHYRIRPFDHRLIFFRADPPKPERFEPILKLCSGEPLVIPMQCNHIEMIKPPGAHRLGRLLQEHIDARTYK